MEINRTTDYAVRVVLHLAAAEAGSRVRASDIAAAQGIPLDYVPKVLQALARSGILATTSGRTGGVRLIKSPQRITLLDIVEAMEGPIALNRCMVRKGECPRDQRCPVHPLWAKAQAGLVKTLREATIAGLLKKP